jgi:pimeloyl-ACP methyl ester carboxylesterase
MTMTHQSHLCLGPKGYHRMAFVSWSEVGGDGVPTICVHGLTRNSRDFDPLAAHLAKKGPVLAPDVVGRGASDWLRDPAFYAVPYYAADIASLIARLDVKEVNYVGTSMGGLIGMVLAGQPGSPIRRLVLNDIGPFVPKASLERIGGYVGNQQRFASLGALEAYLRTVHAPFGPLTDAQWAHMAQYGSRKLEDGARVLSYDPGIAVPMRQGPINDVVLWPLYDQIACPTLVMRGATSDLLLPETAQEMAARGPKAEIYEVAGCGHAPALMAEDQIARVAAFLA